MELDTDDTKSHARDIERIHGWVSISMLGSAYCNGEAQMRKALIALIAIVSLAGAGILFAAPKATNSTQRASAASTVIDILNLTRQAKDLPDQSYPTH